MISAWKGPLLSLLLKQERLGGQQPCSSFKKRIPKVQARACSQQIRAVSLARGPASGRQDRGQVEAGLSMVDRR